MLTVQLAGHASSGELVKTRLTFVELASQDCKVRTEGQMDSKILVTGRK